MKIKHFIGALALLVLILAVGCGGGTLGLQNVNSTQVYTTGGYTLDTVTYKAPVSTTPQSQK